MRYTVVRYPTYYAVVDNMFSDAVIAGVPNQHPIVFESRSQNKAHAEAERLNKMWDAK